MSAIQPLLLVLEAAEKARDEALSLLEGGQRQYDAARQQAQSLNDWRRDYQQRWQKQFQQSGGMEIMRCYQDFMHRLSDAQTEQDRRVEQARVQMERCRLDLIERERRVAAVSQLIDRRHAEQRRVEQRQDQKATDEIAARTTRLSAGFSSSEGETLASF